MAAFHATIVFPRCVDTCTFFFMKVLSPAPPGANARRGMSMVTCVFGFCSAQVGMDTHTPYTASAVWSAASLACISVVPSFHFPLDTKKPA